MTIIKLLAASALVLCSSLAMAQDATTGNTTTTTSNPISTAGSVSSFDSHNIYQATERVVSTAMAPSLSAGFDTCMGSTSGAVSTAVIGIAVGSTYTDANCQTLKNARELWNMGQRSAALARMCMDKLNREALETSGFDCSKEGFAKLMRPAPVQIVEKIVEKLVEVERVTKPTEVKPIEVAVVVEMSKKTGKSSKTGKTSKAKRKDVQVASAAPTVPRPTKAPAVTSSASSEFQLKLSVTLQ